MKYFLKTLRFVVALITPAIGYCATPVYEIQSANGTFIQVPLRHELFRYSKTPRLDDVVVLDSTGTSLPFRVVSVAPIQPKKTEEVVAEPLVYFPIASDATPDTLRELRTTQIKTSSDKTQVFTSNKVLNNATPDFYLVDVSKIDRNLSGIGIDWTAQTNNQYIEVELEATRDLTNWFSLAKATLVNINQDGESLVRNIVSAAIEKGDIEFLRIKILRGADNLMINRVFGEIRKQQQLEKPMQETWSLQGESAKSQTTVYLPSSHSKAVAVAAWEFVRNEVTPVDSVAIDLDTRAYAGGIKIFSRASENANWILRHQGIWFNTQIGDKWEKSNPISTYAVRDTFWRVELNESMKASATPKILFGWSPYQLQIITNNKPPYTLAIEAGEKPLDNRDQVFNQILSATNPQWMQANLISLSVPPSVLAASEQIDWKQWLFWVALILAVGVLLAFSLRLLKQLNNAKPE